MEESKLYSGGQARSGCCLRQSAYAAQKEAVADQIRGGLHEIGEAGFAQSAGSASLDLNALGAALRNRAQVSTPFNPSRSFTRGEVLAVLRAMRGVAGTNADTEYQKIITTFERME